MNIFIFFPNLELNAKWFFDQDFRRANKQISESTQMISMACPTFNHKIPISKSGLPYKINSTHFNNKCSIWTRSNLSNFYWHKLYVDFLCKEFESRRGKKHYCEVSLQFLQVSKPEYLEPITPIFIGKKDLLFYPHKIIESMSVYEKYKYYLWNKHFFEKQTLLTKKK